MFELSKEVDLTVVSDIGPEGRCALIIDNFYQDPDAVREATFDLEMRNDSDLLAGLPGWRVYAEDFRVKQNLKPLFDNLKKQPIWKNKIDDQVWDSNWDKTNFLCNVMNSETRDVGGGIPHTDSFDVHLGAVIYLNKPEECNGGTRLYSLDGRQSASSVDDRDAFRHLYNEYLKKKWEEDCNHPDWKVEFEFEMVYNRCIVYEADLLHSQWYDESAFTEHFRIAQVLFM